jgi:hypothetical protein
MEIQTNDTAYFLGHRIRHRDGPLDSLFVHTVSATL